MAVRPAAKAAAAPPDEPPGVCAWLKGLLVVPCTALKLCQSPQKIGVLVLPSIIAPAARKRSTTMALVSDMRPSHALWPTSQVRPSISNASLMVIGTPCRGPSGAPLFTAASARAASFKASSKRVAITALMAPLCFSMRSIKYCVTATELVSPDLISAAMSQADCLWKLIFLIPPMDMPMPFGQVIGR